MPNIQNERAAEYAFVLDCVGRTGVTSVLDIGTGFTALPALLHDCGVRKVSAIDRDRKKAAVNKHWPVTCVDLLDNSMTAKWEMVTCISTLEHIMPASPAVRAMLDLLTDGGYLVMTFPYCEGKYIRSNYELPGASYGRGTGITCQSFSRKELDGWCDRFKLKLLAQKYWRMFSGPYWANGQRLRPYVEADRDEAHQLTCVWLQKKG